MVFLMLNIGLQFFAHKKGGGSTKNGRDSNAKRLGVKRADGQEVDVYKRQALPQGWYEPPHCPAAPPHCAEK